MKILVTGTAGFIGFHLANRLLEKGVEVIGLDIINDYYDVNLKYVRLEEAGISKEDIEYGKLIRSSNYPNYQFIQLDLNDLHALSDLFVKEKFKKVCNLAAQAGVRYSLENPHSYIQSNIVGFVNLLECCRHNNIEHLIYASSSSVYGLNKKMPLSTFDNVDHPISLYAASKKSNELMAHTYSHLYNLPTTGLRFFTVYGPWGRPDMALFLFTEAIIKNEPIKIFNYGEMVRDFTYIDDIIEGVTKVIDKIPLPNENYDFNKKNPSSSSAPYSIYNIGNNNPISLLEFVESIEKVLGKVAKKEFLPIQPGDVKSTYADISPIMNDLSYKPKSNLKMGIENFIKWYLEFYNI